MSMSTSDHHVGGGGPKDDFSAGGVFLSLCYEYRDMRRIVIDGDGAELHQFSLDECIDKHPIFFGAVTDHVTDWVLGNHDRALWKVRRHFQRDYNVTLHQRSFSWNGTLWVHGNDPWDRLNSGTFGFVGKAATVAAGWAEMVHPDADKWLSARVNKALGYGRHGEKRRYYQAAQKLKVALGMDRVIHGHDHGHHDLSDGVGDTGTMIGGDMAVVQRNFIATEEDE